MSSRSANIDTVKMLIRLHRATIADIAAGKKFTRAEDGRIKDVTREIRVRCKREIAQCEGVLQALQHMGEGEFARASELLSEIKEYLPREQ
jgi:uncharacterized protein (DUF305 family)